MKKILNLVNLENSDIKYKLSKFPDGEPHIEIEDIDRKNDVLIKCRICNPDDLFILMQVGDILNRQEIPFELHIYYLMSSRMDRVMNINRPYSLKIVSQVINSLSPKAVRVLEPHSKRTEYLINNYTGAVNIDEIIDELQNSIKVAPDKGAFERLKEYLPCFDFLYFNKTRDLSTGKIVSTEPMNTEITKSYLPDTPFLVIDDLCDGGSTFKAIAGELHNINPNKKKYIFVTHMVNPVGIKVLSENYDKVYFTNSYKDWDKEKLPKNVKVIKII